VKQPRGEDEVAAVRARILDAALEVLATDGFSALTMRRLGARMGMTAPNLYNYFSSKDEIYLTLMTRGFEELLERMNTAAPPEAGATERARAAMAAYVRFGLEQPRTYELMFADRGPRHRHWVGTEHEALSAAEHALSMRLVDVGDELIRGMDGRGRVTESAARLALVGLFGLLHGMVSLVHSGNMGYIVDDPEEAIGRVTEALLAPGLVEVLLEPGKLAGEETGA
jgi:AcrR family transcriptional regulator